MKYKKDNFPDFAQKYFEATGKPLSDLIERKFDNDSIKMEFKRLKLKRPSRAFLDYYRRLFNNPADMTDRVNVEFREFLRSKLGLTAINSLNMLDAIILTGYQTLKSRLSVSTPELLKAIELRLKYKGEAPKDIQRQIDEIFKGKDSLDKKPEEKKKEVFKGGIVKEVDIPKLTTTPMLPSPKPIVPEEVKKDGNNEPEKKKSV